MNRQILKEEPMKDLGQIACLTLLFSLGCAAGTGTTTEEIEGHTVTRFTAEDFSLVHVQIDDANWIALKDDDSGGKGPSGKCVTCKISAIGECAREACPPIKEKNPNASCRDAIERCTEKRCIGDCAASTSSAFSSPFENVAQ